MGKVVQLQFDDPQVTPKVTEFSQFWAAYPKKVAKKDAMDAWYQVRIERPPLEEILAAINNAKNCQQWRENGGTYIPHPATWLRRWGWADEYEIDLPSQQQWERDNKKWYETASGIEAKGKELGIYPHQFEAWPLFKQAVLMAVK